MIKTVLFDLDGTLLPMDQDEFVKAYFGLFPPLWALSTKVFSNFCLEIPIYKVSLGNNYESAQSQTARALFFMRRTVVCEVCIQKQKEI